MQLGSIEVMRPVTIKVKVTDSYKKVMQQQLEYTGQRLESEIQHLEQQGAQLAASGKQRLEEELTRRRQTRQQILDRLQAVREWQPGEIVVQGRTESLVKVKIGDDWNNVMGAELLLENGKIIDITAQQFGEDKVV